jgi:hypothetical protein
MKCKLYDKTIESIVAGGVREMIGGIHRFIEYV